MSGQRNHAIQSRERSPLASALRPLWLLPRLRRRSSSTTRAPVATPPAPTATTGRTQLRGSRSARSSLSESSSAQSESSSAAAWVTAENVSSIRPESRSGGSIGRSASLSSASTSQVDPLRVSRGSLIFHLLLQLFDRAVRSEERRVGKECRSRGGG